MSGILDHFVQELLEKTRTNKISWKSVDNFYEREQFATALGDSGYQFQIWTANSGDDRSITLKLSKNGQQTLESEANNWVTPDRLELSPDEIKRFRHYSDLFDAVRENVYGNADRLGEVEELLRKIS